MKLFGRKRYWERRAELYADSLADAYNYAFQAGRVLCQMGHDCPQDRPQFPTTVEESHAAGFFDGWVHAQCEIFDETDEGVAAIEAFLAEAGGAQGGVG